MSCLGSSAALLFVGCTASRSALLRDLPWFVTSLRVPTAYSVAQAHELTAQLSLPSLLSGGGKGNVLSMLRV